MFSISLRYSLCNQSDGNGMNDKNNANPQFKSSKIAESTYIKDFFKGIFFKVQHFCVHMHSRGIPNRYSKVVTEKGFINTLSVNS